MCSFKLLPLLGAALLLGSAPASAFDTSSGRLGGLERQLDALDTRIGRAPRAAKWDLRQAERELHVLERERGRDPRLGHLRQRIIDQRWQADRAARELGARPGLADAPRGFAAPKAVLPADKSLFEPGPR